jgi:hypothetical protein
MNSVETTNPSEIELLIQNVILSPTSCLQNLTVKQLRMLSSHYLLPIKHNNRYILIKHLIPIKARVQRIYRLEQSNYNEECPVCFNTLSKTTYIATPCAHIFCKKCILKHIVINENHNCPLCRSECEAKDIFILPFDEEIQAEIGILVVTPEILNTNHYLLDNIRQQYVTNPTIIEMLRTFHDRQSYTSKIILFIHIILIIIALYILAKI